ncbi:MAG TPA: peptidylprolyl isomerase [Candidatus Binatia bacterium]|nr:peptidylprolyl isomerase [Candidatus Binatia bacterium]
MTGNPQRAEAERDDLAEPVSATPAAPPSRLRRVLREPLLHFALLGGLVFAAQAWLGPVASSRRIVVDESMRRALRQEHVRRTGSAPTADDERALVERYVDDEVLVREALRLGLDRGDVIVRRRLVQKMEFLAEEAEPIPEPTDEELARFLERHAERYGIPARVALTHVFVSGDRHGDRAEAIARELRAQIEAGANPADLGDPFPRGRDFGALGERDVAGVFGDAFAARVMQLPVDAWSDPIRSTYGWHLVRPTARTEARPARVADVRTAARLDWLEEKRAERRRAALDALRERYEVVGEP